MVALAASRRARRPRLSVRDLDLVLVLLTLFLAVVGVLMVFSATRGPGTAAEPAITSYLQRQAAFVLIGSVVAAVVAVFDYRQLRDLVPQLYGGMLVLLFAVLLVGVEVNGAKAWFDVGPFQLQPSEFGKIVVIVVLAAFFGSEEEIDARRLVTGLALVGLPVLLIMGQPDLGTVLVYGAITAGIVVVAGVRGRYLAVLLTALVLGATFVLNSNVLEDYQVGRLIVFVDDRADVRAAYNLEQAQIAIGNGGLSGEGLFNGTQNRGGLVPEQQTDFIWTVVGEELGFRGAAVVLAAYGLLLWRVIRSAQRAADRFGALLCAGVASMLLFQIFQSVGMTMGMMPITGIPLPLLSYGGSSIITTFAAIGLVLSTNVHRFR
jgi:rod shape determining protein RodA